jgi:hypothetical protein
MVIVPETFAPAIGEVRVRVEVVFATVTVIEDLPSVAPLDE